MAKWFKRRVERLLDNLIFAGIMAGGVAVWTAMNALPLPAIIGIFAAIFVVIMLVIRLGILRFFKSDNIKPASQIYDSDLGRHLSQIEEKLKTWRKQLLKTSNKKGFVSSLQIAIEKQRGFYQVVEHCPSIHKNYEDLRLSRVIYEAKLKSKSVTSEDDEWLKGRMKALAEAINNCLLDGECLDHSCPICIEKHKKVSEIGKTHKSAIGGLIGRADGGKVSNSHYKGKITIHGNPEGVDVGGLIGQEENTEVIDSSADAEIEYKQD